MEVTLPRDFSLSISRTAILEDCRSLRVRHGMPRPNKIAVIVTSPIVSRISQLRLNAATASRIANTTTPPTATVRPSLVSSDCMLRLTVCRATGIPLVPKLPLGNIRLEAPASRAQAVAAGQEAGASRHFAPSGAWDGEKLSANHRTLVGTAHPTRFTPRAASAARGGVARVPRA